MNRQSMKRVLWLGAALALLTPTAFAALYTYTGLGSNPSNWSELANWNPSTNYPSGYANDATIPNGTGPIVFINTPTQLRHFTTGDGHITMPSTLTIGRGGGITGAVNIGTGGITFTAGGLLSDSNGGKVFNSAGTIIGPALCFYDAQPVQSGGHWDVRSLGLGSGNANSPKLLVKGWDIRNAAGMRIGQFGLPGHDDQSVRFDAAPNITGGRPDWDFISTSGDGGKNSVIDLNGFTLVGNRLRLDGRRNGYGGSIISNSVAGGALDLNSIQIGLGNQVGARMAYLILSGGTEILLQGSGTVWETDSTNSLAFNIRNDTTVTFGSAGGSVSVHSGSKDRNSAARDPADWENNFAFDKIRIASGATLTLTGNAMIEGGGNTALYATSLVGEGAGATVNLNGRNVYLLKSASNITFTGAGAVYQQSRGTAVLVR